MPQRVGGHAHVRSQVPTAELVDRQLQVHLVRRSILHNRMFSPGERNLLNIRHGYSTDRTKILEACRETVSSVTGNVEFTAHSSNKTIFNYDILLLYLFKNRTVTYRLHLPNVTNRLL